MALTTNCVFSLVREYSKLSVVSVPGTVTLAANTGLLAMQHAMNQQNAKSINI